MPPRTQTTSRFFRRAAAALVAAGIVAAYAPPSHALQPLGAFVQNARAYNPDNRAAVADAAQRDAESDIATGGLLPTLTAGATYTRNQRQVDFALNGAVYPIILQNQIDANVTLTEPLIDVGNLRRLAAARRVRDAARVTAKATALDTDRAVARDYFQVLGAEALVQSARRALDVARANLTLVTDRKGGGTASQLDVDRAESSVLRAEQTVGDANLNLTLARRDLATVSGLDPLPATNFPAADDLHPELPLETWLGGVGTIPQVVAARLQSEAAEDNRSAARLAWLPTLSGTAQEKFTNATAFTGGHSSYYQFLAVAAWKLDATLAPQARAQAAAAAGTRAREDKTRRQVEDAIFDAWQRVATSIDKSRSARSQVQSSASAAELARVRYVGGVATQLDVLQAQQDAFSADIARIQADADLAYARAELRLAAGRPLGRESAR